MTCWDTIANACFRRPTIACITPWRATRCSSILQGIWAWLLTLSATYGDLLDYVIFAALLFYVRTVAAIFILRRTQPHVPRPYAAIGYPVAPAGYIVLASLIMIDLLIIKPRYTWPGLLLVASGVPVFYWWRRYAAATRAA
jgi:basic amino acid/polyamine antiporter, APA family